MRNSSGQMVPFSAFATSHWQLGPPQLDRYNGCPAARNSGRARARQELRRAPWRRWRSWSQQAAAGIGYEWTGLSYQELLSGAQAPLLYALSILVVFLCLAALYESWSIPLSRDAGHSAGRRRRVLAASLRGLYQRHLFPGGPAHHHGPGGQERDPDRRVREVDRASAAKAPSRRRWRRRACACGRS